VSLEDDMIRIFGGEQVSNLMSFFKIPEDQPLQHSMVSRALNQAQVKVEGFNFDIRKHLVDFDDVINQQRSIIYNLRRKIVFVDPSQKEHQLVDTINDLFDEEIRGMINMFMTLDEPNIEGLAKEFSILVGEKTETIVKAISGKNDHDVEEYFSKSVTKIMDRKNKEIGQEVYYSIIKGMYLETIDKYWTEHLTAIDDLREGINLRSYAQLDPLVEYKNQAFSMFEKLLFDINYEIARRVLKVEVVREPIAEMPQLETANFIAAGVEKKIEGTTKTNNPVPSKKKLGRNDPCWCGSGKKYKKCHYPN
jgi:preprotein translocase subunit SecA